MGHYYFRGVFPDDAQARRYNIPPPGGVVGRDEVTLIYPTVGNDARKINKESFSLQPTATGFALTRLGSNAIAINGPHGLKKLAKGATIGLAPGDEISFSISPADYRYRIVLQRDVVAKESETKQPPVASGQCSSDSENLRPPSHGSPSNLRSSGASEINLDSDDMDDDDENETDDGERERQEAIEADEAVSEESSVLGGSSDEERLDTELHAARMAMAKAIRDKRRIAELKRQPAKVGRSNTRKREAPEEEGSGDESRKKAKSEPKTAYGKWAKSARKDFKRQYPEETSYDITARLKEKWAQMQDEGAGSEDR